MAAVTSSQHSSDEVPIRGFSAQASRALTQLTPDADPIHAASLWLSEARDALGEIGAESATLATVGASGEPNARIVLIKHVDDASSPKEARGFLFFTSRQSTKATELMQNPSVAVCFHWLPLGRQLRIRGSVTPVTSETIECWWRKQCRSTQIGEWASKQSAPISDDAELEKMKARVQEKFKDGDIPRPDHWIGYRIIPKEIEFWIQQPSKMHNRHTYKREEGGRWEMQTVAP